MMRSVWSGTGTDHCRIGSLENKTIDGVIVEDDHCRIGSLETWFFTPMRSIIDHCRIGSLEN